MTAVSCFIARDFFIRIRPYQFPFLKNILGAFSRYPFQLRASTPFSQAQHSKKTSTTFPADPSPWRGFHCYRGRCYKNQILFVNQLGLLL